MLAIPTKTVVVLCAILHERTKTSVLKGVSQNTALAPSIGLYRYKKR